MRTYELTVLVPTSLSAEEVKTISGNIGKLITSKKGSILKDEPWGKKSLAYSIKKQAEANFLYYDISLDADQAQALEREVRLMDTVIRVLFVLKEEVKA